MNFHGLFYVFEVLKEKGFYGRRW